jgi:hypothetical protein
MPTVASVGQGKFLRTTDGRFTQIFYVSNVHGKSELCMLKPRRMAKTIRKYASVADLDEIKVGESRYWQSRPVHERMHAVSELSLAMYGIKGTVEDAPRLERTLVRIERRQS